MLYYYCNIIEMLANEHLYIMIGEIREISEFKL